MIFFMQWVKSAFYYSVLKLVQQAAQQTALCCSAHRRNTPLGTFTQLKAISQSVMLSALQDKVL